MSSADTCSSSTAGATNGLAAHAAATLTAIQKLAAKAVDRRQQVAKVMDRKIMIVDDEEYNIFVLRKYLRAAGYQNIVYTDDSREAVGLICSEQPDIVLLDIMMPHVNGLDILSQLMSQGAFDTMPVLILSSSNESKIKQAALELGATDFLSKPIDPEDLMPRVRNALFAKYLRDQLVEYAVHLESEVGKRMSVVGGN